MEGTRESTFFLMSKLFLIVFALLATACGDRPSESAGSKPQSTSVAEETRFSATDSIELLYYPDPANQKNYQVKTTSDTLLIRSIVNDLQGAEVSRTVCPHHLKAYLFSRSEVFKTIYMSDSCQYIAFASSGGQQHFRALSEDTRMRMKEVMRKK